MTSPIDTSLIPAQVRAAGPQAEKLYGSALQFEQMLVQQLAQGLTDATQSDPSSEDGGDSGSGGSGGGLGVYKNMLPDALAQSVTSGGGMGLAMSLYQSMGGKGQSK
jgi:Rod binding domain-containing protein